MFENISTKRLKIGEFSAKHSSFILELLNTEAFIKFIGDRNVRTENDAKIYIEDILKLKTKKYWLT